MNQGLLNLSFSEYVNPATYMAAELQLRNVSNGTGASVFFTGGTAESNLEVLTIRLRQSRPLQSPETHPELSTVSSNTFISLTTAFIRDASRNEVVEIMTNSSLMADNVVPDVTPPVLTNFTLDLDTNELILTFDEVINVDTLDDSWTLHVAGCFNRPQYISDIEYL